MNESYHSKTIQKDMNRGIHFGYAAYYQYGQFGPKAKSFEEAKFFVLIFTYYLRLWYRSKLDWSTQKASSMHLRHGTSLLSTPLPFWTFIITLGKKNDDEECCFLK